jgi:hypothetical protein
MNIEGGVRGREANAGVLPSPGPRKEAIKPAAGPGQDSARRRPCVQLATVMRSF